MRTETIILKIPLILIAVIVVATAVSNVTAKVKSKVDEGTITLMSAFNQ